MAIQQTFRERNIYKDFDLSFTMNPLTKDIGVKTDVNAIIQAVKNLLNTNYYERPFEPRIGSKIRSILFEPADPITISDLRSAIAETIGNYEPRVLVKDIEIKDLSDKNAYHINLIMVIQGYSESREVAITLKRLR